MLKTKYQVVAVSGVGVNSVTREIPGYGWTDSLDRVKKELKELASKHPHTVFRIRQKTD